MQTGASKFLANENDYCAGRWDFFEINLIVIGKDFRELPIVKCFPELLFGQTWS